jgi:flavin reductase (DIM6/NTAB) family NADH-FMN oxidoreductase RutF
LWEERLPGADVTESSAKRRLVDIDTSEPVWERFFTVAPLVLIGTTDEDGAIDMAPKHMVTPMGWQNYFGFVCTPSHRTCSNIERSGEFTVSYPKPSQVLYTSLAASPRIEGAKPILNYFDTNCLITGEIVAARAESSFIRASEHDSQDLIHESPLFAYLSPGRFAAIDKSNAFPFPAEMKK